MSLAFALIIGAVLIGVLALCAVALRARPRRVAVGAQGRPGPLAPPASFSGLSKEQAEELLDWLEAHGYRGCEVSYDAQSQFTVRCR
jgi:hypothetical protein